MDQNTKDALDALDFIKKQMATKGDLENLTTADDIADLKAVMATKDDIRSITVSWHQSDVTLKS